MLRPSPTRSWPLTLTLWSGWPQRYSYSRPGLLRSPAAKTPTLLSPKQSSGGSMATSTRTLTTALSCFPPPVLRVWSGPGLRPLSPPPNSRPPVTHPHDLDAGTSAAATSTPSSLDTPQRQRPTLRSITNQCSPKPSHNPQCPDNPPLSHRMGGAVAAHQRTELLLHHVHTSTFLLLISLTIM